MASHCCCSFRLAKDIYKCSTQTQQFLMLGSAFPSGQEFSNREILDLPTGSHIRHMHDKHAVGVSA